MKINYNHWFKSDHWTFEEAAHLLSNIDPFDEVQITLINHYKYKRLNPNTFKSAHTYKKFLQLLKGTDLSKHEHFNVPAGSISLIALFAIAKEKNIGRFPSRLVREWEKFSNNSTTSTPAAASAGPTKNPISPFKLFHDMKHLHYDEITISFLDNDLIELSARDETKSFTYQSLELRDMRKKGETTLNKAGSFLGDFFLGKTTKPDPKNSKNKDRLKGLINTWFGLKGDAFQVAGEPPSTRYEAKFTIKGELNRAGKRIEKRATHVSLEDTIETANFDVEDDAGGKFLKDYD